MGINILTTPSAVQQSFLYTDSGVTKNDLILRSESGSSSKASTGLPISQSINNNAGTTLLSSNRSYASYQYNGTSTYNSWGKTSAELGNGNIVLVYPGDGSTNVLEGVNIQICGYGVNAAIKTVYVYDSGVRMVKVSKINSTSFVVCWQNSSNELYFDIYSNSGTSLLGTTLVTSGLFSSPSDKSIIFNVSTLSNGNIIIAYQASGDTKFKRYNSSGTLQGSEVTVEASTQGTYFQILPLSSGNFVITYMVYNTYVYRFAIYDGSNTVVKAPTTITTSNSSYYLEHGYFDNTCVELRNGNIAFITANTTQYTAVATTYTSTGTLVTTNIFETNSGGTTYLSNKLRPGLCSTSFGFAVVSNGASTYNYLYTFDLTGVTLSSRVELVKPSAIAGGTNSGDIGSGTVLMDLGAAGLVFSMTAVDSSSYYGSVIQAIDYRGNTVGTAIANYSQSNTYSQTSYQNAFLTSDGNVYKNYRFQYGWNCSAYYPCRKSIYGVAQETVSANSIFKVATAGAFNLTSSYQGATFNTRTNTIPGTKGSVAGSVATLEGLV